ncbi:uncharacterized protein LOC144179922 [Haemaphysalis longicornis]
MGTLNYSVDPCEDFRGHVCSGGRRSPEERLDTAHIMRIAWYKQGARFLEVERKPAVAAAVFDACVAQLSEDVGDLARVLQFFRERGIPWPAPTGGRYHALDVLLDLVINWGVAFFFELTLSRRPGRTRYSLFVKYIDSTHPHEQWVKGLRRRGASLEYARLFYQVYGAGSAPTAQLEQLLRNEISIAGIIAQSAAHSSSSVPFKLEMAEVGSLTPNLSVSLWLTTLNKHFRPYTLRPDDELLMAGDAVGTALNEIFIRYSNDQILESMAWWFVQMYSYALSPLAAVAALGNQATAALSRRQDCYVFVESFLQRALLYERAKHVSLEGQDLPATMQPMFRHLQDAAIRLARSACSFILCITCS